MFNAVRGMPGLPCVTPGLIVAVALGVYLLVTGAGRAPVGIAAGLVLPSISPIEDEAGVVNRRPRVTPTATERVSGRP